MEISHVINSELFWYRMVLVVGVIAIPVNAILIKDISPESIDFMSHRLILSGMWLLAFILSFVNRFFREWTVTTTCWLLMVLYIWASWIVYLNNFIIVNMLGFLVSFCVLTISIRRPRLFYPFMFFAVVLAIFSAWMAPALAIDFGLIVFTFVILGLAFVFMSSAIMSFERKLNLLNQTLEKRIEERTVVAEERAKLLAMKNRELEQFAYVASHDLKSPLRSIGGFIQLIQRKLAGHTDSSLQEYLDFVVNAVKKMSNVIEDVLQYSRFGEEVMAFSKTEVKSVIDEVCSSLHHAIEQKNATVIFDKKDCQVWCDRKQLMQLFQNLVENGLKYNKSNSPVITITVTEQPSEFVFSVKDNGIGILPEYQDKIFKIFQRLHTDEEYAGTGVGLAICKRIVENHKGEIWIEPRPNDGSTFFFTIQKNLAAAHAAQEAAIAFG